MPSPPRLLLSWICAILIGSSLGCSPAGVLNAISFSGGASLHGRSYRSTPEPRVDVYTPEGAIARPIVVFLYGGGWRDGDRGEYRFVGDALRSRGYVAVLPDLRNYPAAIFPTNLDDAAAVVAWARTNAIEIGGDPERIFLMGHSSGAHLAVLLALDDRHLRDAGVPLESIRGVIGLAGPYDFQPRPQDVAPLGMTSATQPAPETQPIAFAHRAGPPMLLIQGSKDTVVEPRNAIVLTTARHYAGGEATARLYSNAGHVDVILALARGFRWIAPTLDDVDTFIRQHAATTQ